MAEGASRIATREDIEPWIARLIDMPCWFSCGTVLDDFGFSIKLGKKIRRPDWSVILPRTRELQGPDDPVFFRGEAQLYVRSAFWRLESDEGVLASSANMGSRAYDELPKLVGSTVIDAQMPNPDPDLILRFSNGLSLRILVCRLDPCDSEWEDAMHWSLLLGNEHVHIYINQPWEIEPWKETRPYCNRHMPMDDDAEGDSAAHESTDS